MNLIWHDQNPVLVLNANEGSDKPYMDKRDNSVWYRTNATNRRASEQELAVIFTDRHAPEPYGADGLTEPPRYEY